MTPMPPKVRESLEKLANEYAGLTGEHLRMWGNSVPVRAEREAKKEGYLNGATAAYELGVKAGDGLHAVAIERATALMHMDPDPNSADGIELLKFARAVEAFEKIRWPINAAAPEEDKK